jgi:hypothetical protein
MLRHGNIRSLRGVCFFADDDNVYSKTLLRRMQSIRRVGVWAASHMCITETRSKVGVPISYLVCDEGATVGPGTGGKHRVSGFCSWQGSPARRFQLDFAQFAVNLGFALERLFQLLHAPSFEQSRLALAGCFPVSYTYPQTVECFPLPVAEYSAYDAKNKDKERSSSSVSSASAAPSPHVSPSKQLA